MGQKITQSKQTIQPDVDVFLLRYCPFYQCQKLLNNGLMSKSALVTTEKENFPLIAKIFYKSEFKPEDFETGKRKIIELQKKIEDTNVMNIAPITLIEDIDKAGMIIRQYYAYNLKERTYTMPYLSHIEKIWIAFQILFAVKELHTQIKVCHGDIKMENILLNSNGSVYLSDISPFKPAYIQNDDISTYTYFFGSNDDAEKACYLAPERLLEIGVSEQTKGLSSAMDVFSLGALFVELFIDEPIFDFSKLLNYKKGTFKIDTYLNKVKDETMRDLFRRMLVINPAERVSLNECLNIFADKVCPITIPKVMLHFNTLLNTTSYWKPDMVIGAIYKHWNQIWKCLYGLEEESPILYQQMSFVILNKLIIKPSFLSYMELRNKEYVMDDLSRNKVSLYNFDFLFSIDDTNTLNREEELKKDPEIFNRNNNKDCIIFFLNYIFNNIGCVKYQSSGLVALEMLKNLSTKVNDLMKLQYIVPYFVSMLQSKSNLICITSLHFLIDILHSINYDELILPTSDYNIFDSYIYPNILSLYESKEVSLTLEFTNVLDTLIELEETFLNIALKSKLQKLAQLRQRATLNTTSTGTFQIEKLTKEEACYKAYDQQLEEFKRNLYFVIEDLLSKNDEIDVTLTLIRKLPYLLNFYGGKNNEEFSKFIITNFNKKEWVIQKEIVKYIPEFVISLDEKNLTTLILPCMEVLATNCINEHKIYELCCAINKLIKNEYISSIQGITLFLSVLPFLVHPNMWIRKEVMEIFSSLTEVLNPNEVFIYLYSPIKDYLEIPVIQMTPEIIRNFTKPRLCRTFFQLELGNFEYKFKVAIEQDMKYIKLMDKIKSEIIFLEGITSNQKVEDYKQVYQGRTLYDVLTKEFQIFKNNNQFEELSDINQSFFGKVFWFSDSLSNYSLPMYLNNREIVYKEDNKLISIEQFKLRYLFKTLGISLKLVSLNELFEDIKKVEVSNENPGGAAGNKLEIKNYYAHKNFSTWKPQGRFISTLYSHNKKPIEKLVPSENNQFASFDSSGGAILWQVETNKIENCFNIKKQWSYFPETPKKVNYNKTICGIDNSNFVIACDNVLYKYFPQYTNATSAANVIYTSAEYNDITCCLTIGKNSQESQQIVFCNRSGLLNILDQRNPGMALTYEIPIEKGMISCICNSIEDKCIYLGTLGGYIMKYDLRINSIVKNFRYSSNTPIISMSPYKPYKYAIYDLYTMNKDPKFNKYLLINAGADDHEVGLWNVNSLNCDVLFKVNIIKNQERRPLTLDLPRMYLYGAEKDNNDKKLKTELNLKKNFSELKKYTYKYNSNFIRGLLMPNVNVEYYQNAERRLNKILSIYEAPGVAQCAISPCCDKEFSNAPYIFTAGNDMAIRYWDIAKEGMSMNEKRSFIFNAPNSLSEAIYSKSQFNNTTIIQSNEEYRPKGVKRDMPGFSEYMNFNGNTYCASYKNEFDESDENLKYCMKIADASHCSIITDILPLCVDDMNGGQNMLISGSWDGTVKVWR